MRRAHSGVLPRLEERRESKDAAAIVGGELTMVGAKAAAADMVRVKFWVCFEGI